jgi:hypothetical protein
MKKRHLLSATTNFTELVQDEQTLVITVWPSFDATKSLTFPGGATSSLLPPIKFDGSVNRDEYDALTDMCGPSVGGGVDASVIVCPFLERK